MKFNQGFSLIEVLIATMVLAIGLLGLAATQTSNLQDSLSAYQRSQATRLAYSMADRMRANILDAKNSAGTYATAASTSSLVQTNTAQSSCKTTAGCTAALMAQNDIYEWNNTVNTILPSGQGTISFADPMYIISINWNDDRDDDTAALSFQISFLL